MPPPKTPEQRALENRRAAERSADAGLATLTIRVPATRIPELRGIALDWRKQARLLLDSDYPTADQILQIHGVCRTLALEVPARAFDSRASAASWLLAQEPKLARRRVSMPRSSSRPGV